MKKRIVALCLVLLLILPLAACKGSNGTVPGSDDKTPSGQSTGSSQAGGTTVSDTQAAPQISENAALANRVFVNSNVGKGMYAGTPERNTITVECSTMSVMNTIKMTYNTELSIARHCYDTLVKLDAENNIVPAAAISWEAAPNAAGEPDMVWTFHLRPGAKWVDSTGAVIGDLKASDFVFAWKELLNPENAAEYYGFAAIFKNAQAYYDYKSGNAAQAVEWEDVGIKAVDDLTLQFELETYLPYLLQYLKFEVLSPVCEEFYTNVGASVYGTAPDKMAYCGAFYMTDWITDNVITVKKNPFWWDADSVSLEAIRFAKYTDANTKYNAFAGGEIDIIDITGEQRAMFSSEGYGVSSYVGGYSFYFQTNSLQNGPNDAHPDASLSDMRSKNLRKAISFALDRRQIIDTVFKNDNEPAQCFTLGITGVNTPTFGEAVVAENGGPLYPEHADSAKAKEYLALALTDLGYTDPAQINITLMTSEGSQNELQAQVVQEQLRQVLGIEAKIDVLTITEARVRRNKINYDMFMGGWGPDYNDPMTDLDLWMSSNGNNHTGYANPAYDALIESTKTETDPVAREKIFIQAEQMIAEDMFIIPVYWRHEDYVASEKIASGAVRRSFQGYFLAYVTLSGK